MCDNSIKVILNDLKDNYSYAMTYEKTHADYQIAYLLIMYSNINKIVFGTYNLQTFFEFVRHPETVCSSNVVGTQEQVKIDMLKAVKNNKFMHDQNWAIEVFENKDDAKAFVHIDRMQYIEEDKQAMKTTIVIKENEIIDCYFTNNPWKLSMHNREQKVYRYCVLCGVKRFTDNQWSREIDKDGPPSICDDHPFEDDPLGNLWSILDDSAFYHPYCSDNEYARLRKEESFTEIKKK